MAATDATASIAISQKGNVLTVPTHITETTKILKENGETVEIVTVTLGSPKNSLKSDKTNIAFAAKTQPVTVTDAISIKSQTITSTASSNQESNNELMGSVSTKDNDENSVTLIPSNSLVTVIDDGQHQLSDPRLTGQLVHVVEGADQELIVQTTGSINDYSSCLVCGDRGSGFHYSVFSCEGCKGFFKRSVQKNLTYTCKNEGNCDINKLSRNNCQYCRFKKCLQFGMKKEGVRDDRTPGGLHKSRYRRYRDDEPDSMDSQYDLETSIQTLINCDPYISPSFVTTEEKTATLYGAFQLTAILHEDLACSINWAKLVPGFKELDIDDQKILLNSCMIELSLFRLTYRSMASTDGRLRYAHDIELTLAESEQLGFDQDYVDTVVELVEHMKALEMDDKEYAIISAIILFYEDALGLRDTIKVSKLQQRYLSLLQRYIKLVYSGNMKRFGRLLLSLPGLRTKAMNISETFESFIIMDRTPVAGLVDNCLLETVEPEEMTVDQVVISTATPADLADVNQ